MRSKWICPVCEQEHYPIPCPPLPGKEYNEEEADLDEFYENDHHYGWGED